jgi:SAM-dependent methyltransferase
MHGELSFVCNICDRANLVPRDALSREAPTCGGCGSSVRTRSLVHLLSFGLFGRSLALRDFPHDRAIRGLGLGDWPPIAAPLAERLAYANLDDGRAPWQTADRPPDAGTGSLDFILASDLLQLVAPPVQRAFDDLRRWLRPGGLLVLTVPFDPNAATREHFPDLHEPALVEEDGRRRLYNTRRDGLREAYDDLVFHGADRLEMRLFGLRDLLDHCARAGFREAAVQDAEVPERGIVWRQPWSVPIVARA